MRTTSRKLLLGSALIAGLALTSAADVAGAYPYHHHRHRYCVYRKRRAGAIGAVAGAVGGGIIGSAITHGAVGGTLLGAGAGALTGHALARSTVHCYWR
jgi:hypothetical protein